MFSWFKQRLLSVTQPDWHHSSFLHPPLHPSHELRLLANVSQDKKEPLLSVLLAVFFWPVFSNVVLYLTSSISFCPVLSSTETSSSSIGQFYWVPIFSTCLCKLLLLGILAAGFWTIQMIQSPSCMFIWKARNLAFFWQKFGRLHQHFCFSNVQPPVKASGHMGMR